MIPSLQDKHIQVQQAQVYKTQADTDRALTGIIDHLGSMVSKASGSPIPKALTQLSTSAYMAAKYR